MGQSQNTVDPKLVVRTPREILISIVEVSWDRLPALPKHSVEWLRRDLGFAAGILGTIWALGGSSSLLGAIFADRTTQRLGVGPTMIVGSILYSIALLFIPLARGATLLAALLLVGQQILGDGAVTLNQINQVSLRQAITPDELLGRVNGSVEFLNFGAALVDGLLGGLMGDTLGVRTMLILGALGSLLSTIWLMLSPVPALRMAPVPCADTIR